MRGEVRLGTESNTTPYCFDALRTGEGVISEDHVRIRINSDTYLHFRDTDEVDTNHKINWPDDVTGELVSFRLIAQEI